MRVIPTQDLPEEYRYQKVEIKADKTELPPIQIYYL